MVIFMFEHLRNCLFLRIFFYQSFVRENTWEKRRLERSEQNGQNSLSCNHSLQLKWTIKHLRMCWTLRRIGYNSERTHWILIFLPKNRNPSLHWEQAHPPKKVVVWCNEIGQERKNSVLNLFWVSYNWLTTVSCLSLWLSTNRTQIS